jgi:hypothetical protein
MVASNCQIGIVGAETSGVDLASLLIELGFQVALFEKAPHPLTERYGILLVPCPAILPGPISGRNSGQGWALSHWWCKSLAPWDRKLWLLPVVLAVAE